MTVPWEIRETPSTITITLVKGSSAAEMPPVQKLKAERLEEAAWDLYIAVMEDPRVDTHTADQVAAMARIKEMVE